MNSRDGVAAVFGLRRSSGSRRFGLRRFGLRRSRPFAEQCLELGIGVGERLVATGEQRDRAADLDLAALVDERAHHHPVVLGLDVDGCLRRLDGRQHAAGGERRALANLP